MRKRRYYYNGKRCSKGEKEIIDYLISRNILFEREYTFDDCVSPRNHKLRFDFYLSEYGVLIEYQGEHHERPVNKYRRAKKVHEQTVISDQIKKRYLEQHNIPLIELSYRDFKRIREILDQLLR